MGTKTQNIVETRDVGLMLVPFAFTINGTSNPVLAANNGDEVVGQQVTRTGAGVFTFQIDSSYAKLIGIVVGGIYGASGDIVPQCTATDPVGNSANNTTIKTMTGAAPADPSSGSIVSGILIVKKNIRRASL